MYPAAYPKNRLLDNGAANSIRNTRSLMKLTSFFRGARPVTCIRNFHPESVFVQSIAVFAVSFDCFSGNQNGGRVNVRTGASSTGNRAVP